MFFISISPNFQYLIRKKTFSIWFSRTCLFCPFKVMCCTYRNCSSILSLALPAWQSLLIVLLAWQSLAVSTTSLAKFGSEHYQAGKVWQWALPAWQSLSYSITSLAKFGSEHYQPGKGWQWTCSVVPHQWHKLVIWPSTIPHQIFHCKFFSIQHCLMLLTAEHLLL